MPNRWQFLSCFGLVYTHVGVVVAVKFSICNFNLYNASFWCNVLSSLSMHCTSALNNNLGIDFVVNCELFWSHLFQVQLYISACRCVCVCFGQEV